MRQQLIKWLIEDVIPEAQKTGDPEQSILKFSHTQNLAPAQVEMLGQLFNTAKTLSHLEKSASRGSSFSIIDVPKMVAKYLETPSETHTEWHGKNADVSLPTCLSGWERLGLDEPQEIKLAAGPVEDPSVFAGERKAKAARRDARVEALNLETMKQAASDFREEGRRIMETVHRALRSNTDLNFAAFETDALSLYGEPVAPVMDKLASYIKGCKWPITRGQVDTTKRLIPDHAGLIEKVASLLDLHYLIQAADEGIKQATAAAPALADPAVAQHAEPAGSGDKKKDEPVSEPAAPAQTGGKGGGGKGKGAEGGQKSPTRPIEGFFGGMNKGLDTAAGKGYGLLEPVIQKSLGGGFNTGQQTVDRDYIDARHMATLQRLMATDEVLSEADPDKVVETYNTIREVAPSLAGDANVMRVVLRSAVQHDGISSFDLKSFLDTEAARQKTDYNRRLTSGINYGGGEMGNRPA